MRVSDCQNCIRFTEMRYVDYYKPRNYHGIGMTHKYGFCTYYGRRCKDVKRCGYEGEQP